MIAGTWRGEAFSRRVFLIRFLERFRAGFFEGFFESFLNNFVGGVFGVFTDDFFEAFFRALFKFFFSGFFMNFSVLEYELCGMPLFQYHSYHFLRQEVFANQFPTQPPLS